ncbi:UNVERIFIED_CONTAM: hypothetical protein GTU68_025850 [Idotea baltica]|nr:hypothetical protein [Idotea baltica]
MRRFLDKDFVLISSLSPRTLNIPVCYDRQFGLDLDHLAKTRGLSHSDIIRLHTGREYQVFMLGFLPGFVYLGNSHDSLVFGRRPEPRLRVPASSVGLAGNQTGIYPSEAPGGWQIIGRTPIPIFLPTNDQPFLFNPGDRVRFYDISHSEYLQIRKLEKPWSSLKIDIPTND